ncbi:MAG: hypothetical protein U9M98_01575 [Patescibacteria group bacterium]|nr:hypothetical protein [Patescibacteria group bacterium]
MSLITERGLREFLEKYTIPVAINIVWLVPALGLAASYFNLLPHYGFLYSLLFAFPAALIPFIAREILQKRQLQQTKEKEFKESARGESWKEPHFVRNLTKKERKILGNQGKFAKQLYLKSFKTIFLILLGVVALSLLFGIAAAAEYSAPLLPQTLIYFYIFGTLATFFVIREHSKERKIYKDLQLPVKKVCGNLIKQEDYYDEENYDRRLIVRGVTFSGKYNDIDNFWNIDEEDQVIIEYSPNTKKIWNLKTVNNN